MNTQDETLRLLKRQESDFDNIYSEIANLRYDINGVPFSPEVHHSLINQILAKYFWTYTEYQKAYSEKKNIDATQAVKLLNSLMDGWKKQ